MSTVKDRIAQARARAKALTDQMNALRDTLACACCKAVAAEVQVPPLVEGEGELFTCWLCAHMLVHHEVPVEDLRARLHAPHSAGVWCDCAYHAIFPPESAQGERLRREEEEDRERAELSTQVRAAERAALGERLRAGALEIERYGDGSGTRRGVSRVKGAGSS